MAIALAALTLAVAGLDACKRAKQPSGNSRDAAVGQPKAPPAPAPSVTAIDAAATKPEGAKKPVRQPVRSGSKPPAIPLIEHSGNIDGPIEYIVLEPHKAPEDTPLLVGFHGRGDSPEGFSKLARALSLQSRAIMARGPLRWGRGNRRQWFVGTDDKQVSERVEEVATLVAQLKKRYPKARKVVAFGFSQGGMLLMQVAARKPKLFDAMAPLSAFLPLTKGNVKTDAARPMWVTVGRRDKVIAPERTHEAVAALKALGHTPEVHEFDGGHQIPRPVLAKLRAFLDEQLK